MAAEIAATNERSALKPVGSVLIPGAATKCKGRVDRTKLNRTSGDYVNSREDTEGESDEEDGGAEEWLGKDEDFVSTLSDLFPLILRLCQNLETNREITTLSSSLKMQSRREMLTRRMI